MCSPKYYLSCIQRNFSDIIFLPVVLLVCRIIIFKTSLVFVAIMTLWLMMFALGWIYAGLQIVASGVTGT